MFYGLILLLLRTPVVPTLITRSSSEPAHPFRDTNNDNKNNNKNASKIKGQLLSTVYLATPSIPNATWLRCTKGMFKFFQAAIIIVKDIL